MASRPGAQGRLRPEHRKRRGSSAVPARGNCYREQRSWCPYMRSAVSAGRCGGDMSTPQKYPPTRHYLQTTSDNYRSVLERPLRSGPLRRADGSFGVKSFSGRLGGGPQLRASPQGRGYQARRRLRAAGPAAGAARGARGGRHARLLRRRCGRHLRYLARHGEEPLRPGPRPAASLPGAPGREPIRERDRLTWAGRRRERGQMTHPDTDLLAEYRAGSSSAAAGAGSARTSPAAIAVPPSAIGSPEFPRCWPRSRRRSCRTAWRSVSIRCSQPRQGGRPSPNALVVTARRTVGRRHGLPGAMVSGSSRCGCSPCRRRARGGRIRP